MTNAVQSCPTTQLPDVSVPIRRPTLTLRQLEIWLLRSILASSGSDGKPKGGLEEYGPVLAASPEHVQFGRKHRSASFLGEAARTFGMPACCHRHRLKLLISPKRPAGSRDLDRISPLVHDGAGGARS